MRLFENTGRTCVMGLLISSSSDSLNIYYIHNTYIYKYIGIMFWLIFCIKVLKKINVSFWENVIYYSGC